MITLYTERKKIMDVFNQLFKSIEPKELKTDVFVGEDFDYIPYQVYGAASFSPKDYLNLENLNYSRDEQGISYLDTFIKLCIQVGGAMQYNVLSKEIKSLEIDKDYYLNMYIEMSKKYDNLRLEVMPKGDVNDELIKVRKELRDLTNEVNALRILKNKVKNLTKYVAE